MQRAFVRFGHGYEESDRGRCDAFDGFTILAAPLGEFDKASRESRVFRSSKSISGGTDYGSHAVKFAEDKHNQLYILMHHGGGREVLALPTFYSNDNAIRTAILAMPERLQYALLHNIWKTARNARDQAQRETRAEWAQAFYDKRIRKRKRKGNVTVEIIPQWEIDLATRKKAIESAKPATAEPVPA